MYMDADAMREFAAAFLFWFAITGAVWMGAKRLGHPLSRPALGLVALTVFVVVWLLGF